jgi:hypothetical protein
MMKVMFPCPIYGRFALDLCSSPFSGRETGSPPGCRNGSGPGKMVDKKSASRQEEEIP